MELLKLLTRTSPLTSEPWLLPTSAVPYGLISPLAGTVEPIVVSLWNPPIKDPGVPACAAGAAANTAVATAPAKAVAAKAFRCVFDTGHSPFHGWFPPGTGANGPEISHDVACSRLRPAHAHHASTTLVHGRQGNRVQPSRPKFCDQVSEAAGKDCGRAKIAAGPRSQPAK